MRVAMTISHRVVRNFPICLSTPISSYAVLLRREVLTVRQSALVQLETLRAGVAFAIEQILIANELIRRRSTVWFGIQTVSGSDMVSEILSDAGDITESGCAQRTSYILPQMLDLMQAAHLRDDMVRLAIGGDVLLDAAAVERMSTPCAQVLLAAGRAARAFDKSFKITNASETFRTAIADLGLQTEFANWMD